MIYKTITFTIFFLLQFSLYAQIKTTHLTADKLPKEIVYDGKLKDAIHFKDKQSEHYVLTTETGIYKNNKFKHENDGSDAELFAYHYILNAGKPTETWKVYDNIVDCDVDLEAKFIKKTLQATDLDKDGIAEIWLMYKTVCHGDVSPCTMKIIMYEGQEKYAMRGENKVQFSEKEYQGGKYKFDKAFFFAPAVFRNFAEKLWKKNIMQVWE